MHGRPLPALPTVNPPPGVPSPWFPPARLRFALFPPGPFPPSNAGCLSTVRLSSTTAWTERVGGIADDAALAALVPGHRMVGCQQFLRLLKPQRQASCATLLPLSAVPRRLGCVSRRVQPPATHWVPPRGVTTPWGSVEEPPRRGDGDGGRGAKWRGHSPKECRGGRLGAATAATAAARGRRPGRCQRGR